MALYGIQMLVPQMLAQHAPVALSQPLHYEPQEMNADVGVSAVCPAPVQSNIAADVVDNNNASGQLNDFLRSWMI